MMLEHLGQPAAAAAVVAAIERALLDPKARTGDLGGEASTAECGAAVVEAVLQNPHAPTGAARAGSPLARQDVPACRSECEPAAAAVRIVDPHRDEAAARQRLDVGAEGRAIIWIHRICQPQEQARFR
jgi:hypothetical protein